MPPRVCKPSTTTTSPPTNQPTPPMKCHYTINYYICTHKTWSKTPRIMHQQPCPFAQAYFSKSNNQNRARCANMEKSPKSVDVRELCPKCRPHTLGVGPVGKKVREHEVEVLEGNLRGGEEREEKREDNMVLKNDDGNGVGESMNCAEDDIDMKGKWMDVKPSSSSRSDTSNIPSVTNGDAETPASLSIFKRVLGAMIPGSSSYSTANREEDFKNGGGADKEEDIQESGEDKKGEGKGKGKQSWIQVDEDPNWEVVGGERK